MTRLAIDGGSPVRSSLLPYGRQQVDPEDVAAVVDVLSGDWLTTGPAVEQFEQSFAGYVEADHAVAVNSGTAALHAAAHVLDLRPGDQVIVPALTFAASANCVLYEGGEPVFVDVEPDTLLIDSEAVAAHITDRTRAIIAVDYAGQPCDYDALRHLADRHGLALIADACHAPGATYRHRPVGTLADLNTFSFHPVKHLTTGEGGMATTANAGWAQRMRWFRNHGITTDHRQRAELGSWYYEMKSLGYNYRLSDVNCVLGTSQLQKLPGWIERRRAIAKFYQEAFADLPAVQPLAVRPDRQPAWHIYPVLLDTAQLRVDRAAVFAALRAENIGVNVHYIPVYWHPIYVSRGYERGLCPAAEAAYARLITLPLFPAMDDRDVLDVISAVRKVTEAFAI